LVGGWREIKPTGLDGLGVGGCRTDQLAVGFRQHGGFKSKNIPGGFAQVGSLTGSVPVKTADQTTRFAFTYTVTSDDKAIGKVTFRADASIIGHRDALPADNELQSTPVSIG